MSDHEVLVPPVVYVPLIEPVGSEADIEAEMRRLDDGRVALFAYSALDRLLDACPDKQPWLAIPTASLADGGLKFDEFVLDMPLPSVRPKLNFS